MKKSVFSIVFAVWFLAFLLMLFPIRIGAHFWDETVYLQNAEVILGLNDNYNELDFRPPFLSFLIIIGFLLGQPIIISHILVSFIISLGVFGSFLVGKELYDEKVGLISAIFYLFLPLNIYYAHFILTDFMMPVFLLFSTYFLINSFKTSKKLSYFFLGIFFALAILVKFSAILFGPIFLISFFIFNGKKSFKKIKSDIFGICLSLFSFLIILAPYLIYSKLNYGSFFSTMIKGGKMVDAGDSIGVYEFLKQIPELIPVHIILLFIFGIVWFLLSNKFSKKEFILLIMFLLPFVFLMSLDHKELRFFALILPPAVIFSSYVFYNLLLIKNNILKLFFIFVLFSLLILNISLIDPNRFFPLGFVLESEYPAMQAGKWINQNAKEGYNVLYANSDWPVLTYYSKLNLKLLFRYKIDIYDLTNVMNEKGYFVTTSSTVYFPPSLDFVLRDRRFSLVSEFENLEYKLYIFEYDPSFTLP